MTMNRGSIVKNKGVFLKYHATTIWKAFFFLRFQWVNIFNLKLAVDNLIIFLFSAAFFALVIF